jgi:hypothetical protein
VEAAAAAAAAAVVEEEVVVAVLVAPALALVAAEALHPRQPTPLSRLKFRKSPTLVLLSVLSVPSWPLLKSGLPGGLLTARHFFFWRGGARFNLPAVTLIYTVFMGIKW